MFHLNRLDRLGNRIPICFKSLQIIKAQGKKQTRGSKQQMNKVNNEF